MQTPCGHFVYNLVAGLFPEPSIVGSWQSGFKRGDVEIEESENGT